ncbi:MAG: class I SAM-dependent methyltransferase [Pseudomonadota bacterium]
MPDDPITNETDLTKLASQTLDIYERNAARFDRERPKHLHERGWLDRFCALLPERARILDLGCGAGDPFYPYLAGRGYSVTGIDQAEAMLAIARAHFPDGDWRHADMRVLDLSERFDGIFGWNSFFHLTPAEQRTTLDRLGAHLTDGGALMLTVGPRAGDVVGWVGDDQVYRSSLSPAEYQDRLSGLGLRIVDFVAEDPDCDFHTVLLAKKGEV